MKLTFNFFRMSPGLLAGFFLSFSIASSLGLAQEKGANTDPGREHRYAVDTENLGRQVKDNVLDEIADREPLSDLPILTNSARHIDGNLPKNDSGDPSSSGSPE